MMAPMPRNVIYLFDVRLLALLFDRVREVLVLAKSGGKNCLARAPQCPFANFVRKSSSSECTANDISHTQFAAHNL
jgi:hypothetical protein